MAIVERGKGRNRQTIEIKQEGCVLRMQEVVMGDQRLPGYRRYSSAEAASQGLAAEVRVYLRDGMKPADDDSRAIASQEEPAKVTVPTLPVRRDLGVYNEATGLVVTSRRMAGKELEEGSEAWKKAVKRGDLLPLSLMQDDPFVIRVVVGAPLTKQEEEEWVARVDWHLNVSDGQLCVCGGAPFSSGDYEELESYHEQFVAEVAIPKGRYKAALYTYFQGVNGSGVMDHLAGGYGKAESEEDWCDRTRPGQNARPREERENVEFLLHLEPVESAPKHGLSELPADGWFGGAENARKPELCPLGLEAKDVQRRAKTESGQWVFVRDTFPMLKSKWGNALPESLTGGGTVALPLTSLACAARLAWFASRQVVQELRLKLPAGGTPNLAALWTEGVVATAEDGVIRILFSADFDPLKLIGGLPLADLPAGTVMDLCSAPVEFTPGVPAEAGWLWLRGTLRDGNWTIARALPAVSKEQLADALALAREVDTGKRIAVKGKEECDAIMAWARRNFGPHLSDNPPKAGPDAITFKQPGHEVHLLGVAAFAHRFANVWPVWDGSASDEWGDDDDDDDMFPSELIKGALLYTTPAGRTFHQTMALLISQGVDTNVRAQEKALKKAGFKELGDVMCAEFEQIGFHCYFRSDKSAIAWFRVSFPDEATCEILSLFEGGPLLLTSASATIKNRTTKGIHVQEFFGASPADLLAHHHSKLEQLLPTLGSPQELPSSVSGLAQTLALVLDQD